MPHNLWKPAPIKAEGGQAARRRTFWLKFFWYPAVALGVLMLVLTLRLGVSRAIKGPAWQKAGPPAAAAYAMAPAPQGGKPLATLGGDDDDDDDGDDGPTICS